MQMDSSLTFHGFREALASVTYRHSAAAQQTISQPQWCVMMNILWAHVFSGVSGYGLSSADLGWVYAHIWDLMFSVALAGMKGISALFLCFSFQQAHPGMFSWPCTGARAEQGGRCQASQGLGLTRAHCYCYYIQVAKASISPAQSQGEGKQDSPRYSNCKITRQRSEVAEEMKNVLGH